DLFMRAKLEALLPGHRVITVDHTEDPELVLADVSRVDPEEAEDAFPDIPIVGFTNHTDTAGLRAAHAAGSAHVLAKSARRELPRGRAAGQVERVRRDQLRLRQGHGRRQPAHAEVRRREQRPERADRLKAPRAGTPPLVNPKTLDHVAYWLADRDAVADFV